MPERHPASARRRRRHAVSHRIARHCALCGLA